MQNLESIPVGLHLGTKEHVFQKPCEMQMWLISSVQRYLQCQNTANTLGIQIGVWENDQFTRGVEYYITKLLKQKQQKSSINAIKTKCKY